MRGKIFISAMLVCFAASAFGLGIKPGLKAGYMNMSVTPKELTFKTPLGSSTIDLTDTTKSYTGSFGELSLDVDLLMGVGFGLGIGYASASNTENNNTATISSIRLLGTGNFSRSIIPGVGYYVFLGPVVTLDKLTYENMGPVESNIVTNFGINTQAGLNISLIPVLSIGGGMLFDYMLKSGLQLTDGTTTMEIKQSQHNLGFFLKLTMKLI